MCGYDTTTTIAAAMAVVQGLDGTYGKTWAEVADELTERGSDGERTCTDPTALADLIRALLAHGALRE